VLFLSRCLSNQATITCYDLLLIDGCLPLPLIPTQSKGIKPQMQTRTRSCSTALHHFWIIDRWYLSTCWFLSYSPVKINLTNLFCQAIGKTTVAIISLFAKLYYEWVLHDLLLVKTLHHKMSKKTRRKPYPVWQEGDIRVVVKTGFPKELIK
jgi:hypothetical protein